MNVSYEWLRAFVPFDETPAELRELLTMRVATVDELTPLRADLADIVVGRVVEEAPHPDSDHLHVTRVDAGTGELLDVVCGAPNVAAGKLYPFAKTGTLLPNGVKIERRKIRGAVSNGMLCSARELGLGDDHQGILELDVDVAPGTPLLRALPLGDTRIVVDVLPNRPDLLSHLGIAREVAAGTGRRLELPAIENASADIPAPRRYRAAGNAGGIAVHVEDAGLVNRFMGVVIRGVKVGPSPRWLVERLEAVGSRSINNVVDASNYVLHELGQPTHAFDLARLEKASIVVRRARAGETITTLDGAERKLDPDTIVIADAVKPQAIGGIMGGQESEVSDTTTDIFVEVANFNPKLIRGARRRLGLTTDASYRFERGVDVGLGPRAVERLARIIIAVAGGVVDGTPVDIYVAEPARAPIAVRATRVEKVLGEPIPSDAIAGMLREIGFETSLEDGGATIRVVPPSWRADAVAEVDVIEEVARLWGYNNFPDEIRPVRAGNVPDAPLWTVARRVRDALVGAGLLEVRPMPFVKGAEIGFVRVANPLSENEAYLRRDLLDTLARRAEHNLTHMQGNIRIFEIGDVFLPIGDNGADAASLPREELHAAVLAMGERRPAHFTDSKPPAFDEWDAKALGELLAREAHPGAAVALDPAGGGDLLWTIVVNEQPLGLVRRVSLDAPVWASAAFGVELSLGVMSSAQVAPPGESAHRAAPASVALARVRPFRPLPTTPPAEFDLALLVRPGLEARDVETVIRRSAGELLERLELFDQYVGEGVEPGWRSLAWRLTFRDPLRTLRDKEIEGRRARILAALKQELDVSPRTS